MTSPRQLFENVSAGRFCPAYYFFGTEDYRKTEAEKFIVRQFLPDRQLVTNFRKIDGSRTSCADLLAELSSLPMLGERQAFVVSSIQSYSAKELRSILSLLDPPQPDRLVIMSSPAAKTPRRNSSFFSTVSKASEPVEFKRLTKRDVQSQIHRILTDEGLAIEPPAADLLAEIVSGSRGALVTETAKLINYRSKGETITKDDVRQLVTGCEVHSVFQVADIVVAGDTARVLRAIESLVAAGTYPSNLISLMLQHFISLYLVKNGKKPLGKRGFLTAKFAEQAARYDNRRLEQIIIEIADAEAELRRGRVKPAMALQVLALTLTGGDRQVDGGK